MYSVGTIDDIRTNNELTISSGGGSGSEFADLAGSLGTRTTGAEYIHLMRGSWMRQKAERERR